MNALALAAGSLSPSEGEVRVRILRNKTSRFEPLNRQRRVGLGVLTAPRPSDVSSMPGGGVRTPSPTFRFVGRGRVEMKHNELFSLACGPFECVQSWNSNASFPLALILSPGGGEETRSRRMWKSFHSAPFFS